MLTQREHQEIFLGRGLGFVPLVDGKKIDLTGVQVLDVCCSHNYDSDMTYRKVQNMGKAD